MEEVHPSLSHEWLLYILEHEVYVLPTCNGKADSQATKL